MPRTSNEHQVINVVLDEILAVTQIDPSAINPDDHFREQLGISPQDVQLICQRAGRKLKLHMSDETHSAFKRISSPRELVDLLKAHSSAQTLKQAA
jgi:hypothetical protein